MKKIFSCYLLSGILFLMGITLDANAESGKLLAKFTETVNFFVKDKHSELIYATTSNSILIINPATLTIDKIGGYDNLAGLDLSEDGSTLYVAKARTQEIIVYNTATSDIIEIIKLPEKPYDVKYSRNGYLYVTLNDDRSGFLQVDLNSKQSIKIEGIKSIYGSYMLQISPDHKTLFLANRYMPDGLLLKYSIGNHQPELIYTSQDLSLGFRGQDLHLTEDGKYIFYVTDTGNKYYGDIARIQIKDMAIKGLLATEFSPSAITTSPDGKIAYTYNRHPHIAVWDTEKQIKLCEYRLEHSYLSDIHIKSTKLIIDKTGQKLLAAFYNSLEIYETGCTFESSE